MRQPTLRRRLQLIIALAAAMLLAMPVVDVLSVREVNGGVEALEHEYVPLLRVGADAQARLVALTRAFQEAVAAQDPEALEATAAQKAELEALLSEAPALVDRADLALLRRHLDEWYASAFGVSQELFSGVVGEELTVRIADMQEKHRVVERDLERSLTLDPARLAAGFERARRVGLYGLWARMSIRVPLTILVVALAIATARRLVRSLDTLRDGFERIGRGEFDRPVPAEGRDELADAARHANRMAGNLKALDAELRRGNAELERTNRELESFSYSVSHDLRAPLRSVDGFSQAVLEDYGDRLPEQGQDYLRRVRAGAQRMAALVDDLLRLSRVGRAELHRAQVDVSALARAVAEELARGSPERPVEVEVEDGLVAEGDAPLLRVVLDNLIGNAWKFAGRGARPRVEVAGLHEPGFAGFRVRDNGVGFDMAHAGRLFAPFQRLDSARDFPGTGIGLATVQRVVHRHGGRVWAQGEAGRGAEFSVLLPKTKDEG